MSAPRVSIVIPTLNGGATLPAVLDRLAEQRVGFAFETLAIDSGSTDGSADLLRGRVDCLIHIDRRAFDHGLTRNLGVERARGELVVLMVQDAVPASSDWLAALTRPLFEDPTLAGAFSRQVPRAGASGVTRCYHRRWLAASLEPRVSRVRDIAAFSNLSPMDRHRLCVFDNVCSCIRRAVWAQHPFRATPIAEDLEWARAVLLAGHGLAYVPDAVVEHSHERPARDEFRRTYLVHQRLRALFDLRLIPDAPSLLRAIARSTVTHLRVADSVDPRTIARALALAVAWPLGQYLGARSAPPTEHRPGGGG